MNHIWAVLIKFAALLAVLWIVLNGIWNVLTVGQILILSLVLTVSYAGDLYIMPKLKNTIASATDGAGVFLIVWLLGIWMAGNSTELVLGSAITGIAVGVFEYFYHIYLIKHRLPEAAVQ
ncbi:YndM family protein [Salipaludibacillus sp. CUR1]|uniref:DUF2512 family protein n=1 Tax=Salipaludibacillus sp. CUR1 TaxID=2820003 RepID=UPI001E2E84F2|nr:DUF2512 family protein [Salipaludibacillus sp. CUR1]MCE7792624.1 YndM family protein [Salipaludibacillus sp. CUR1]